MLFFKQSCPNFQFTWRKWVKPRIKIRSAFHDQNCLRIIYNDSWKITAIWKIILPNSLCSKALLISLLSEEVTGGAQSFLIKLCNDHFANKISVAFFNQQKQHFPTLRGDVHWAPLRLFSKPSHHCWSLPPCLTWGAAGKSVPYLTLVIH